MSNRYLWNFILPLLFLLCPMIGWAQERPGTLDEPTRDLGRRIMREIYEEILAAKDRCPELRGFPENDPPENAHGFPVIAWDSVAGDFKFGVTLIGLDAPSPFNASAGSFDAGFPILHLRFSGFQTGRLSSKQFDIQPLIQKYGDLLWEHQQNYMPYRLSLRTTKDRFKIGEDIEFVVALTNFTRKNIRVKELGNQSLYFVYHDKIWGTKSSDPDVPEVVLRPNESLRKTFVGPAFFTPIEFELYCSYTMTWQGVKPSAQIKVTVDE